MGLQRSKRPLSAPGFVQGGSTGVNSGASYSGTIGTAAPAAQRQIVSELTLNYAGSINIASAASIAAFSGNTTLAAGSTLAGGFLYGTQGKLTIKGSLTTANYVAGIIGQLDASAAASLGTTPLTAGWFDMGASITGSITTASGADIVKLTNTTACKVNSAILVNAKAAFFADVTDIDGSFTPGTTASTAAGTLKIKIGGATRYLQAFSSVA